MNLLGISTHRAWIDHPTRESDPYRHVTQYVNTSGWSSQITSGEQLPASHFGGMFPRGGGRRRGRKHHPGQRDPNNRYAHRRRSKKDIEKKERIPINIFSGTLAF